jgi:hypothetical protein
MTAEQPACGQRHVHVEYQGRDNPTEQYLVLGSLDTRSTTQGFVAQYLPKWIAISPNNKVCGGLRTILDNEMESINLVQAIYRKLSAEEDRADQTVH